MAENAAFPYETRLNILCKPLELIDVHAVPGANEYKWFNQTLCKVNDSVVRMAAIEGEYHWHKHDEDDEFFYVVDGELLIDLEDRTVTLKPGQGFVVPKNDRASDACAETDDDFDGRECGDYSDGELRQCNRRFPLPNAKRPPRRVAVLLN